MDISLEFRAAKAHHIVDTNFIPTARIVRSRRRSCNADQAVCLSGTLVSAKQTGYRRFLAIPVCSFAARRFKSDCQAIEEERVFAFPGLVVAWRKESRPRFLFLPFAEDFHHLAGFRSVQGSFQQFGMSPCPVGARGLVCKLFSHATLPLFQSGACWCCSDRLWRGRVSVQAMLALTVSERASPIYNNACVPSFFARHAHLHPTVTLIHSNSGLRNGVIVCRSWPRKSRPPSETRFELRDAVPRNTCQFLQNSLRFNAIQSRMPHHTDYHSGQFNLIVAGCEREPPFLHQASNRVLHAVQTLL